MTDQHLDKLSKHGLVARGELIIKRAEERIQKAEARGEDMTDARIKLAKMKEDLQKATT